MSPEQAAGRTNELGPATDIYSLGATLYHLLVGRFPIMGETPLDMMGKAVRGEFKRPRELRLDLPLPLEAITLKAMANIPLDRYASAAELARDVERWLADEPVSVYVEPIVARVKRWVRRHPATVSAVSVTTLLVLAGSLFVAYLQSSHSRVLEKKNLELVEARNSAEAAEKAAVIDRDLARTSLGYAMKGNDILGSVLANLDPQQNFSSVGEFSQKLKENLTAAVRELEGSAIGSPLVVADMQTTLAQSLFGLGDADQAIEVLKKALATRVAELGPEHRQVLSSQNDLAVCYRSAGMLDKAIEILEDTLKQSKSSLGPQDSLTLACMGNLASSYEYAGQFEKAVSLYSETLALMKAHMGVNHPDTLTSMNNLASGYQSAGRVDLAIPLYEETLKLTEAEFGKEHPETLTNMNNLATAYEAVGRLDEALPLYETTYKLRTSKLGLDHAETLTSLNNLAGAYESIGKTNEAILMYEEGLRRLKTSLGADHPDTLRLMHNLAAAFNAIGDTARAISILEETVRLRISKLGPDHPKTLGSQSNLAACYHKAGQVDRAIPILEETLELMKVKLGAADAAKMVTMNNLAKAYVAVQQVSKASAIWNEMIELYQQQLGADSEGFAKKANSISRDLLDAGDFQSAERHLRGALSILEKTASEDWITANSRYLLGFALMQQMQYEEAEMLLLSGFDGMQREDAAPPDSRKHRLRAAQKLAELYSTVGKPNEAEKWTAKSRELEDKTDQPSESNVNR